MLTEQQRQAPRTCVTVFGIGFCFAPSSLSVHVVDQVPDGLLVVTSICVRKRIKEMAHQPLPQYLLILEKATYLRDGCRSDAVKANVGIGSGGVY